MTTQPRPSLDSQTKRQPAERSASAAADPRLAVSGSASELIDEAREAAANGVDWSEFLDGRVVIDQAPWSYEDQARQLGPQSTRILDHGTGDGHLLRSLHPPAGTVVATDDEAHSIQATAEVLQGTAAMVLTDSATHNSPGPDEETPERTQPFRTAAFDLVLVRHAGFSPAEMFRILGPGGLLFAQIGLVESRPGHRTLPDVVGSESTRREWGEWDLRASCIAAGFEIEQYREHLVRTRYLDIGAIVFFLCNPRSIAEGFNLDRAMPRLHALHEQIQRHGHLSTAWTSALVAARKPLDS